MSNKGLRIKAHLLQDNKGLLAWNLNCFDERSPGEDIGIALENYGGGIWARAIPRQLVVIDHGWISMSEETLFTSNQLDSNVSGTVDLSKQWSFEFRGDLNNEVYGHIKTEPRRHWDSTRSGFITTGAASFTACLTFQSDWATDDRTLIIACGLPDFHRTNSAQQGPWVCIFTARSSPTAFSAAARGDMKSLSTLGLFQMDRVDLSRSVDVPELSGGQYASMKTKTKTSLKRVSVKLGRELSRGTAVFEVLIKCRDRPLAFNRKKNTVLQELQYYELLGCREDLSISWT